MPHTDPSLSIAQRIDLACDHFEAEWKAGKHPKIADFVAAAPQSDQIELRQVLLAIELELQGRGEADTSVTQSSVRNPVDISLAATALQAATSSDGLKKIGRFDLRGVLGSGAFGKVYRAFDSKLGREVAIKVPMDSTVKTDAERVQFLKEARAIATINHPNVCQVFEVGEFGDRPYIVMALVPGLSLADALKSRKSPLPQKQIAMIIRKIASALAAAHEKGIVHRDLKPANIMFDRDRKDIVVMDFGLARGPQLADARSTQSGVIMGTPAYMSPEQARGDAKGVGPSGDVFSLGVILYEMLTGSRPFVGTATEVIGQILHVEPERPSQRRAGIDPRMESICLKAMAKDPATRFSTMKEFAAAIDPLSRESTATSSPGETAKVEKTRGGMGEPESTGDSNLAEVFAVMSAERKKSQAETAAVVEAAIRKTRTPRWILIALGLIGIFGIATLAGLIFFTKSGPVTVTVELNDIDLTDQSLSFLLDDQPISAETLANPIELKPGEHILVVKRGEIVVKRMRLNVTGGRNPGIKVKDITPEPPTNRNIVWTPLIRSAEELVEGDTTSRNADGRSVKFQDGMLILNGANASFRPKFSGKNYIVRAKILQFSGQNVMFNVRRQPGRGYAAWFNNPDPGLDWPTYGLGKSMPGTPYTGLDGTMRRVSDDFPFEFAVAAFGDEITIFVNGVRVIHYKDTDSAEGSVSFALTGDRHAILRDPEICLLDGTELTPADIFPQKEDANLNRALTPEFLTDELKKGNLVKNGSFENSEKPMWSGDSWRKRPDCWRIVSGQSRGGQMSLHINNPESDDVTVTQTVAVKPGKRYLLSGWVKTENVRALETKSHGAYLYVSGGHDVQNTNLEGTKDWTYQAIVFLSLNRNSVSIAANLGNFASTATGKAWFDDLCVIELPDPPQIEAALKSQPADQKNGWTDLFNGKDLSNWVTVDGQIPQWRIENGYMEVVPGTKSIVTKDSYPLDFELHVEFWLPREPQKNDQARANSGVYLHGRHEIQICDGFQNPNAKPNTACGGLYGEIAPLSNACTAPETWQTFDITYHSPRVDANKVVTHLGRLTVIQNGQKVINDETFRSARPGDPAQTNLIGEPGPVMLQDHGSPVRFRNLRIRPLEESNDLTRWQGKWRLVAMSGPEGDATDDKLARLNQSMRIEGNRRFVERINNGISNPYSGTFRINPDASPKEFDFEFDGPSAAGGQHGLYEFNGPRLRLIYRANNTEKPRRAQWNDKGQDATLFEFERIDADPNKQ